MSKQSTLHFDDAWSYNGCRVLRLENESLLVDVLPECGGKIYRLIDKTIGRDYLWKHPRIKPRILPNASNYDDNFSGGWDVLFPSAAPGEHEGEAYPDHGEYWTQPCAYRIDRDVDSLQLHLTADGSVTPTRLERTITLHRDSTKLEIQYRIEHLGRHGFDFVWSLHPALAVKPGDRLMIPAEKGLVAEPDSGRLPLQPAEFTWPTVPTRDGGDADFSIIPESTDTPGFEMLYLTQLAGGWYALHAPESRSGFGLSFDRNVFDTLWLFQSFGGWRGLHVAVVEPCTGYPYDLSEARENGRIARLEPGQTVETATAVVLYTGRDTVGEIDASGAVT